MRRRQVNATSAQGLNERHNERQYKGDPPREAIKNGGREQDVQAKLIANARNYVRLRDEAHEYGLDDDGVIGRVVAEIEGAQERILRQIERGNIKEIGPGSNDSPERK